MRKIENRQYKLTVMRPRPAFNKAGINTKRGRRRDSKLDRRGLHK
jgi:hypothetical protein